jgi:hypothetical protein
MESKCDRVLSLFPRRHEGLVSKAIARRLTCEAFEVAVALLCRALLFPCGTKANAVVVSGDGQVSSTDASPRPHITRSP